MLNLAHGDETGCAFIAVAVVVGIVSLIIRQSRIVNDRRAENLRTLGEKWNGVVMGLGLWDWPRLEMRVDGLSALVTYRDAGRDSLYTKIHIQWPFQGRLRATPQGFSKWLRSLFGGADIEVGDEAFDASFWIEASNASWAREVLTSDIRRGLLGLCMARRKRRSQHVSLDAGPAGLILKVRAVVVDDPEELDRFVSIAALFVRVARGAVSIAGVHFAPMETLGASQCPVCGHAVDGGRTCPECRTPHHDDCWKYSGGCAIFGCRRRAA